MTLCHVPSLRLAALPGRSSDPTIGYAEPAFYDGSWHASRRGEPWKFSNVCAHLTVASSSFDWIMQPC